MLFILDELPFNLLSKDLGIFHTQQNVNYRMIRLKEVLTFKKYLNKFDESMLDTNEKKFLEQVVPLPSIDSEILNEIYDLEETILDKVNSGGFGDIYRCKVSKILKENFISYKIIFS